MSLSVVLPAHNEKATIRDVIEEVSEVLQDRKIGYEIIVVNDGSTDGTGMLVRELAGKDPRIRLVEHFPSRHYGGALKAGFQAATKEWIVFFPTDKQFIFSEIDRFLAKRDEADIISGYRADRRDNWIRLVNAWGWKVAVQLFFGYLCRDIDCGFKLFRRCILDDVKLVTDWAPIDTELLTGAKARGYRIAEVPVSHLPRPAGRATGADLRVIVMAFRDLARYRFRLSLELRNEAKAAVDRAG